MATHWFASRAVLGLPAVLVVAAAMLPSIPANAASNPKRAPERTAEAVKSVYGPLIGVVSIGDQHVTIFSGDSVVARSPVSTGMSGRRTPTGVFSVIGKERYHESNLYSNAPMPWMQRITWSGVAMHEGHLPGYPASHGCIRMPGDFAQRLFGMTRVGMRVIVADGDLKPVPFMHAALPQPLFTTAELAAPQSTGAEMSGRMQLGAAANPDAPQLNPMERGKIEQANAKFAAQEAQGDASALLEIVKRRSSEATDAAKELQATEAALMSVTRGRDKAAEVSADLTAGEAQKARAEAERVSLESSLGDLRLKLDNVKAAAALADAAAFHAAAEAKAAVAERDRLEAAARVATRATEPLSVFVSRKDRRVAVRQGFEPVFEADIEIAEPQLPLGTHVFTAVAPPSGAGAMQWVAITVPTNVPSEARKDERRSGSKSRAAPVVEESAQPALPKTAAAALERVHFSDEVLAQISARLWTGASLIISDLGSSHETGIGTDFVVLTHPGGSD